MDLNQCGEWDVKCPISYEHASTVIDLIKVLEDENLTEWKSVRGSDDFSDSKTQSSLIGLRNQQQIIKFAYTMIKEKWLDKKLSDREKTMITEYMNVNTKRKKILCNELEFMNTSKNVYKELVKIFDKVWYKLELWEVKYN